MAIRSYRNERTADFVEGRRVREFESFAKAVAKAITKLQIVRRLVELRSPPSNRFEALGRDRKGQYGIRINDQYRVCFKWEFSEEGADDLTRQGAPYDVEITDYH
jgi:toxin HigB-1